MSSVNVGLDEQVYDWYGLVWVYEVALRATCTVN